MGLGRLVRVLVLGGECLLLCPLWGEVFSDHQPSKVEVADQVPEEKVQHSRSCAPLKVSRQEALGEEVSAVVDDCPSDLPSA